MSGPPPHTPDGRYFVVVGKSGPRLWRATRPHLPKGERDTLVRQLMSARRAVRSASGDAALAAARSQVDAAKRALGERGAIWWEDGAADFNRRLVRNTPYRDWWANRSAKD